MNNPLIRAFRAAYSELTTPEAIQWYRDTAHQTYLIIATVAVLSYCLVEAYLLEITEVPAGAPCDEYDLIDLALPATRIAGLLMPAKEVVEPVRVLVTPAVTLERVLVTPPNVVYNLVKAILPTAQYSEGSALTSCQGKLALSRH